MERALMRALSRPSSSHHLGPQGAADAGSSPGLLIDPSRALSRAPSASGHSSPMGRMPSQRVMFHDDVEGHGDGGDGGNCDHEEGGADGAGAGPEGHHHHHHHHGSSGASAGMLSRSQSKARVLYGVDAYGGNSGAQDPRKLGNFVVLGPAVQYGAQPAVHIPTALGLRAERSATFAADGHLEGWASGNRVSSLPAPPGPRPPGQSPRQSTLMAVPPAPAVPSIYQTALTRGSLRDQWRKSVNATAAMGRFKSVSMAHHQPHHQSYKEQPQQQQGGGGPPAAQGPPKSLGPPTQGLSSRSTQSMFGAVPSQPQLQGDPGSMRAAGPHGLVSHASLDSGGASSQSEPMGPGDGSGHGSAGDAGLQQQEFEAGQQQQQGLEAESSAWRSKQARPGRQLPSMRDIVGRKSASSPGALRKGPGSHVSLRVKTQAYPKEVRHMLEQTGLQGKLRVGVACRGRRPCHTSALC